MLKKENFTQLYNTIMDGLSPNEKLLYYAIKSYLYGNKTELYPSKKSLAEKAGLSDKTIQRLLRAWRDKGWLIVIKANRFKPVVYRFDEDRMLREVGRSLSPTSTNLGESASPTSDNLGGSDSPTFNDLGGSGSPLGRSGEQIGRSASPLGRSGSPLGRTGSPMNNINNNNINLDSIIEKINSPNSPSEPDGSLNHHPNNSDKDTQMTATQIEFMSYEDNKSMFLNISPELKSKYHQILNHPDFPSWFENWIKEFGTLMPRNVAESLYFHIVSHDWEQEKGSNSEMSIERMENELFHLQRAEAQEYERRHR